MQFIIALFLCGLGALLARKFSLPVIPMYLLLGFLLGTGGIGLFEAKEISKVLGEIGVVLLLFYIGLEIRKESILKEREKILFSGIIDISVNFSFGFLVSLFLGFDLLESFVIASALYLSSSAIVLHSLVENRKLVFSEAETIIWMMVFEDLALIPILAVLSKDKGLVLLVKILLLLFLILIASKIIDRSSSKIREVFRRDDEIPFLLGFSISTIAVPLQKISGISEALIAISLGTAFSEIRELERIVRPLKEIFLAIFFFFFAASIEISENLNFFHFLALLFIAIVSKILSGVIIGLKLHHSVSSGLDIGLTTIPRGEFSILIISLFASNGLISLITFVVLVTSLIGSLSAKISQKSITFLNIS
jgi:CPA2 family monovalent cation:H+ antiporter-2